jgi:hypothetical protein
MNQPASFTPSPSQNNPAQSNQAMANAILQRRMKSGASNFYFIGVLSVINSFVAAFGGGVTFVVGLALTQFVDQLAIIVGQASPDIAFPAKIIGLVLSILISGVMALFGFFAGKGQKWAFLTGMIIYGLDALIMLSFLDWLAFAFHLFFLWGLFTGWQALNKLEKNMPKPVSDFPQDIGVS